MEFSVHRLGAPTMRAITRWTEAAAVTSGPLCSVRVRTGNVGGVPV